MISDKMKDLHTAVDEIIELISDSSKDHDEWERIVSHCKPAATIDMIPETDTLSPRAARRRARRLQVERFVLSMEKASVMSLVIP